jgi:hypothetical protein
MDRPTQAQLQSLGEAEGRHAPPTQVVHWHSSFGLIVIETVGDTVYVNGQRVEPAGEALKPAPAPRASSPSPAAP